MSRVIRRGVVAIFLFCGAYFMPAAADPAADETIAAAHKSYDTGDFDGAVEAYRKLVAGQPRNAALHFNLGNSYFKAGKIGRAAASFQRAFDILPRDSDIRHNLEFVLRKSGEELVPPGVPTLVFRLFYGFGERELAGLHWTFAWISLLLAGMALWRESGRKVLGPWCAAALLAWLISGSWWLARRSVEPSERGVIVADGAEIRSGPGEKFSVSFTAPEGRRVQVVTESGDWLEIGVLMEGAKGWVRASSVEKL